MEKRLVRENVRGTLEAMCFELRKIVETNIFDENF
jgi:hypothetical protein